ncbi:MAG: MMPL family transporter [Planctomycetes bacterium]|nr:MMPL family transporter [Planctomycetota bacterium]
MDMSEGTAPPALEGPLWTRWFVVSVCTLALMAAAAPFIAFSAFNVLSVEATTPIDWVPLQFAPRQAYQEFVKEFESGDVVVVSWPGCELGSPGLTRLVEAVSGDKSPRNQQGLPWFEGVATGSTVLDRLIEPPLSLNRETAVERLTGLLVGPDGKTTLAVIGFTPEGLADRKHAVAWIRNTIRQTAMIDNDAVHMAGPVVDNVSVDVASNDSLDTYAAPGALLILLLTWWSLKSFWYACLVFVVSLWCVGLAFATMYLCGDRMNPVLIVMPVLVLALGVSGGIHLANYLVESLAAGGRRGAATRAVRLGWLPCLLSAGTTAIGLASLVVSELEPIRAFGFHASIAVMATLFTLFLVLPGVFERWPITDRRLQAHQDAAAGSGHGDGFTKGFASFCIRFAPAIVAAFFLSMVVAGMGVPGIRTSVRIDTLFPPTSRVISDYRWIEEHIGPLVPIEVVLDFSKDSPVPPAERLELLERVADRLAETAGASTVMSAALFMPDTPEGSGPLASARRRVVARKLERSLVAIDDMKYIRNHDDGQLWRATARISALREVDYGDLLDQVRTDIAPIIDEAGGAARGISVACTGIMPLVHAIQNTLLSDLFSSFVSACVLITVVIMWVERGVFAGLVAMISNVFPMILMFGFLGWTRTPLDIGSVMTGSIALGMAIDGTLHFLTFYRRSIDSGLEPAAAVNAAFEHCAAATTESTLVCALGILVFSLSSFAPTSRFSWMLALLMMAALAGDLVLLPAMLVGPLGRCFKRRRTS